MSLNVGGSQSVSVSERSTRRQFLRQGAALVGLGTAGMLVNDSMLNALNPSLTDKEIAELERIKNKGMIQPLAEKEQEDYLGLQQKDKRRFFGNLLKPVAMLSGGSFSLLGLILIYLGIKKTDSTSATEFSNQEALKY